MKVQKVGQQSLRVRAPRVSHQAKAAPSGVGVRPRGQIPVRLPSQSYDAAADGVTRTFVVASWPSDRPLV